MGDACELGYRTLPKTQLQSLSLIEPCVVAVLTRKQEAFEERF